ncbi:26S proteasome protein [Artemisia annua]|uniref:26S proteasome protein n=1 Tax=Artemisia annua TaxID=35608 RepID=A0A2U1QPK7_ARTAN|nr:26S proteasome protein [Artemisia annua]
MEIGADSFEQMTNEASPSIQQQIAVIEQLDIKAYTALYSGRTKIKRLLFIGEKCDDVSMQLEALRMAYDEVKKGEDTELFKKVVKEIGGRLGPDYGLDLSWIQEVDRHARMTKEKLEHERSSMSIERKYIGYMDSGDFYYARGALGDALKNYQRAYDYCRVAPQFISTCEPVILVSLEMGNFSYVWSYIHKATSHFEKAIPSHISVAKLQCAAGLANLEVNQYKNAAQEFLDVTPLLGDSYSQVIACQDVGTYGGLCALATFDRAELKVKVIDNAKFQQFLELVPQVRKLILDFYSSRYRLCMDYLTYLKPNLLLDIHMHDHVEILYTRIRNKALIQYAYPYSSLDMKIMATVFKTDVTELQQDIETLITTNQLKARIDSVNKVLYTHRENVRNSTFRQVLETGDMLERDARATMHRVNILKSRYGRRA